MPGFKRLTVANWTEADATNRNFARVSPLVGWIQMEQDDWARELLSVELSEAVPEEIRDLFAIARGAMLYGWFFYPLFRLGEEQLYRVAESAAKLRYREVGGTKNSPRFQETIELLVNRQLIPANDRERWTAARHLRNIASHPSQATVIPPGMAMRMLKASARDIDGLFTAHPVSPEDS